MSERLYFSGLSPCAFLGFASTSTIFFFILGSAVVDLSSKIWSKLVKPAQLKTHDLQLCPRYYRGHYLLKTSPFSDREPNAACGLLRHPVTIISDLVYRFELRLCLVLPSLTSGLAKTSFDCSQRLLVLCSHGSGKYWAINASTSIPDEAFDGDPNSLAYLPLHVLSAVFWLFGTFLRKWT
ncbi:hypothetical protein B0H13DRAFT_1881940 [Mycena leptocephala]|nr:hypothetical protein B0H13DRAFT_1881940 [Mycena leptocephala]